MQKHNLGANKSKRPVIFMDLCSVWDKVNLKVRLGISTDQTDVVPTLDKSDLRSSIKDKCLKCMMDGKDHSSLEIFRPFPEPITRFFFVFVVVSLSLSPFHETRGEAEILLHPSLFYICIEIQPLPHKYSIQNRTTISNKRNNNSSGKKKKKKSSKESLQWRSLSFRLHLPLSSSSVTISAPAVSLLPTLNSTVRLSSTRFSSPNDLLHLQNSSKLKGPFMLNG